MYISSFMSVGASVPPETADTDIGLLLYEAAVPYDPYKQPAEMVVPPLNFSEEQAVAISDPETTITQYVDQSFVQFVRGDADIDAEWDNYVATLDGMGLANYLQVYQDAYDAKYGQ
jgi:putative aldouronate transport system substrate-binding protein